MVSASTTPRSIKILELSEMVSLLSIFNCAFTFEEHATDLPQTTRKGRLTNKTVLALNQVKLISTKSKKGFSEAIDKVTDEIWALLIFLQSRALQQSANFCTGFVLFSICCKIISAVRRVTGV